MDKHKQKQEIFNEYAKVAGFKDWEDLVVSIDLFEVLNKHFLNVCDIVQEQQNNRIFESISALNYSDEIQFIQIGDFNKLETSITNPKNKIQ